MQGVAPPTRAPKQGAIHKLYLHFFENPVEILGEDGSWEELTVEQELRLGQHATVHEVAEIPSEAIGMRFDELSRLAYLHFGVLPVAVSTSCNLAEEAGKISRAPSLGRALLVDPPFAPFAPKAGSPSPYIRVHISMPIKRVS